MVTFRPFIDSKTRTTTGFRRTTTTTGFSENVVVMETRYQMLEVLSFCKQQIKTNVLTFVMKKGEMKLSGLSIFFWKYAKKYFVLESKGLSL